MSHATERRHAEGSGQTQGHAEHGMSTVMPCTGSCRVLLANVYVARMACDAPRHDQRAFRNASSGSSAWNRRQAPAMGSSFSKAFSFMARSVVRYTWVVSTLSWPSQSAMVAISTPAWRRCMAVVCLLCRSRHSRHYLPFLTMLGNLSASTDVAGSYRLQGLDRLTVTRHSFLVPTDRCSGWSPG